MGRKGILNYTGNLLRFYCKIHLIFHGGKLNKHMHDVIPHYRRGDSLFSEGNKF